MSDVKRPDECCPECKHDVAEATAKMESDWDLLMSTKFTPSKTASKVVVRPRSKAIDWDVNFSSIAGKAGDRVFCEVEVQVLFQIQKKMMTDTAEKPGTGTCVRGFTVNGKPQFPLGKPPVLTTFYSDGGLGCGVRYDNCRPGSKIGLELEFLVDCVFDAVFFGKALKEQS